MSQIAPIAVSRLAALAPGRAERATAPPVTRELIVLRLPPLEARLQHRGAAVLAQQAGRSEEGLAQTAAQAYGAALARGRHIVQGWGFDIRV